MKDELVKLQHKISEQIDTISNLEHAHDKVNEEMEQMTLLLAARETDILKSKEEESLHQQLSKQLTETKLVNDKLQEQIKELMEKTDKDVQTVNSGDHTMEQWQLLVASEANLQSEISKREETIVKLREQVDQLMEQLSESKECPNCCHLMKQVEDLKLKCEPLEGRIVAMEKENKELTDEIKSLQEDRSTTTELVTSPVQLELTKCSKELERLKTHLLQVVFCIGNENVYCVSLGGARQ